MQVKISSTLLETMADPGGCGSVANRRRCNRLLSNFSGLRRMLHQHVFPLLSRELAENVDIREDTDIGVMVHKKMRMHTLCLVLGECE